ncbi:N-acyl-D-glutamate deacylase [Zhouia amylolytica]|uniref:N-acyl-D-glutamate deacylase n=1 Tax=Zhouia amylolytica TaxID=376730 RepID=A0A1I6TPG1_9FLAO|nr:amidohydrolase family protein [Zhouia amylolytica]SFS91041.1 N-acyl-D-glutamate deacylase [Zhouia amylolytica]
MKTNIKLFVLALMFVILGISCQNQSKQEYDLVILNGRVMDPETNFDAVRNVGIEDGKIAVITEKEIKGKESIDATGLVVAPGFIEPHAHGQDFFAFKLYLRDGITTALELELGAFPVEDFYQYFEGRAQLNYGATVGHGFARMAVLDKVNPKGRAMYTGALEETMKDGSHWQTKTYDPADLPALEEAIENGLKQGGLGIGFAVGYYSSAGGPEIMALAKLAKKYNAFITTHVRFLSQLPPSGYLGIEEMLTAAKMNDVPLLVHHVPSNCLGLTPLCLDVIDEARRQGMNVVAEFYPYTFANSYAGADYLAPGYEQRIGMDPSDIVVTETGQRQTAESFAKLRKEAPSTGVLIYTQKDKDMMEALKRPGVFLGNDAIPFIMPDGKEPTWNTPYGVGKGHPRGAGAHAKLLRIVREENPISLMEAIAKMSYLQAKWLESTVPQFKTRGRVQEEATADITIFDPKTVQDNATAEEGKNTLPSTGIPYVIVNGNIVVKDSKVLKDVYPGQAIRNPVR